MTPQELKNSILQLAIQGKLVEQRPEEGAAEELLVKSRKKPAHNDDSYDIPETWCWALLPDVADILYGFPFNSERFNEAQTGMPIIRIRDIISGQSKTFSDEECDERYRIKRGDMLVGMDGNFQVAFWNSEDAWLNQRVCKITADPFLLNQNYLFFYLPIILAEINGSVSYSTVKHLSAKILNAMLIPLPPLAEQKRIVAKIEELLPLIDRYEAAWSRLEDFNKRFPADMQKSLLQLAIQGKLVEQRPAEGTGEELYRQIQTEKQALIKAGKIKKEKPLPEIAEDEVPFEIPESWKWVRFWSVVDIATNLVPPATYMEYYHIAPDNIEKGTGKLLPCRTVAEDKVSSANHLFFKGQIIYSKIRPLLRKAVIAPFDGLCSADMYPLNSAMDKEFLLRYLLSDAFNHQIALAMSSRVKMPKINKEELAVVLIPLPPLAEQKRIVAKLEELLPLCEMLKSKFRVSADR